MDSPMWTGRREWKDRNRTPAQISSTTTKSTRQILSSSVRKLQGNAKKQSQHKPKLHNKSVATYDLYKFWNNLQRPIRQLKAMTGTSLQSLQNCYLIANNNRVVLKNNKRSQSGAEWMEEYINKEEFFDISQSTSPRSTSHIFLQERPELNTKDTGDYSRSGNNGWTQWSGKKYVKSSQEQKQQSGCLCCKKSYRVTPKEDKIENSSNSKAGQQWIRRTRENYATDDVTGRIVPQKSSVLYSRPVRNNPSEKVIQERVEENDGVDRNREDYSKEEEKDRDIPVVDDFVEGFWDNSERDSLGMNLMRKVFGFSPMVIEHPKRPYFTIWITLLQIIIFIVVIATYGVAPIGLGRKEQTAQVLMTDLSVQNVYNLVPRNLWIGPNQDDLIHVGAKYSPCIRKDSLIEVGLTGDKQIERGSACCINNDGSGCLQTLQSACSPLVSTWRKWTSSNPGPDNRTSGTVCGQDPRYCLSPSSTGAQSWPDDITQWPKCTEGRNVTGREDHMTCQVVGRPCCVGLQGECVMATREYCQFRRGYFHEDASLCSQVSCMGEICGMLPFSKEDRPDQFYRFFTTQFLHSGLLSLFITILFQWFIQYGMERRLGWWKTAIIYLWCGLCGGLTSCIFMPYYVSAGPDASQFGILAAWTLEIIDWNTKTLRRQFVFLFVFVFLLFAVGVVVPQIDNWAHVSGFLIGLLLTYGLRPIELSKDPAAYNHKSLQRCTIALRIVCLLLAVGIFIMLVLLFYLLDNRTRCENCMYFNCIPFTSDYCTDMAVNITRV